MILFLTLWTPVLPKLVIRVRLRITIKAKTVNLGLIKVTCRSEEKCDAGAASNMTAPFSNYKTRFTPRDAHD